MRERETDTHIYVHACSHSHIYPLVHSSNSNSQNWAFLKSGTKNLFQISLVGAWAWGFEPSSPAFLEHKLDKKVPTQDVGTIGAGLAYFAMDLAQEQWRVYAWWETIQLCCHSATVAIDNKWLSWVQ